MLVLKGKKKTSPKVYSVYLLTPRSPTYRYNKTYIGFSVNPFRRQRQHNGEIANGARTTRRFRPWDIVCIVSGFPDKISALQFEWMWQHPYKSKTSKAILLDHVKGKRGVGAMTTVKRKLLELQWMLTLDPFQETLYVRFMTSEFYDIHQQMTKDIPLVSTPFILQWMEPLHIQNENDENRVQNQNSGIHHVVVDEVDEEEEEEELNSDSSSEESSSEEEDDEEEEGNRTEEEDNLTVDDLNERNLEESVIIVDEESSVVNNDVIDLVSPEFKNRKSLPLSRVLFREEEEDDILNYSYRTPLSFKKKRKVIIQ